MVLDRSMDRIASKEEAADESGAEGAGGVHDTHNWRRVVWRNWSLCHCRERERRRERLVRMCVGLW